MQGAAILAPEGRGDPLLAIEDGSQAGPAGAFSLLAEASADCLHHLVAGYIDGFYNPVRRHSTLDFTSPVKFEAEAMQTV